MNMMYLISFDTAQILGKLRFRGSPQHKMGLHPSSHGYIFGESGNPKGNDWVRVKKAKVSVADQ